MPHLRKSFWTLFALAVLPAVSQAQTTSVVVDFNDIPMNASATTSLGPNGYTVNLIPCCRYVENGFEFSTDWELPNLHAMQIDAITRRNLS
jgi:hypothetical protein